MTAAVTVTTYAADGHACAACRARHARRTVVVGPAGHIVTAAVLCASCRTVIGAALTASAHQVAT